MSKKISIITPSIRPKGLEVIFDGLKEQFTDREEWEWLPRLSIPGENPDLCYQMNQALKEAQGELIVFLQDWIHITPDALETIWEAYKDNEGYAFTFPVGKVLNQDGSGKVKWDWRNAPRAEGPNIPWMHWEMDFAACPKHFITDAGGFDEEFDQGFGWEEKDLARRMANLSCKFMVFQDVKGKAWDHDQFHKHPYKGKPNSKLFDRKNQ